MSEEDRSSGGFEGAPRSRASAGIPVSAAPEPKPEVFVTFMASSALIVDKDEQILQEDRSVAGCDEVVRSRASANAPVSAVASENEAAPSHPQQTSASRHNVSHQTGQKETFFGIPQSSGAPAKVNTSMSIGPGSSLHLTLLLQVYDDDYETRFPPDPIYQEASDDARVYRVYMEESKKYDAYMTDAAREGLDVLLVFVRDCVMTRLVLIQTIAIGRSFLRGPHYIRGSNFAIFAA